jgi:hypothetical protein
MGIFRKMSRVILVPMSTSVGRTSEKPGLSSTSSKVKASRGPPLSVWAMPNSLPPGAIEMKAGIAALTGGDSRLVQSWRGSLARGPGNGKRIAGKL